MNTRSQIFGTYAVKILIAALVLILASFLYLRLDLSDNKRYTLSKATKTALRDLKDKVVVKVFASDDLPPQFSGIHRDLKDLLEEFQRNSRGKLKFEYARAKNTDELIDQARQYNIPPFIANIYEADEMVSRDIVSGFSMEGGGEASSSVIHPDMGPMLEYLLLKNLNRLQSETLPELTVFADSLSLWYQYSEYADRLATTFDELKQNYRLRKTDLKTKPSFTPVMLCLGVADSLSQTQLYHLDQHLMRGGDLVITQDAAFVFKSPQGIGSTPLDGDLFRLLEHHGIKIKQNIVLDMESALGQGPGVGDVQPYTFYPKLLPNPDFVYTTGFEGISMSFASEILPMPGSKLTFKPVLKTSDQSNELLGPVFDLDTAFRRGADPSYLNLPAKTVAAEVSGPFTSYFSGPLDGEEYIASSQKSRIIIFGDSEFSMQFDAGAFIVLNAVDHLLGRDEMSVVRSYRQSVNQLGPGVYMYKHKLQPAQPEQTAANLSFVFKLAAILLPLLLLAFVGLIRALRH